MSQPPLKNYRYPKREAAETARVSLATLDRRISEGKLKVVKDGRRVFVLAAELERYLAGEP